MTNTIVIGEDVLSIRLRLVMASFLALFTELMLIRYIAGHVPVVSYFSNIILIASFFGLGLGFLLAKKTADLGTWFLPSIVLLIILLGWFQSYGVVLTAHDSAEPFWANDSNIDRISIPMTAVVITAYLVSALICIPVGQAMGNAFIRLKHLGAYHLDLVGSLVGVICFGIFSALHIGPILWFFLIVSLATLLFYRSISAQVIVLGVLIISGVVLLSESDELWSTYYKVNWSSIDEDRTVIKTNNITHQVILNTESDMPYIKKTILRFKKPYEVLAKISPDLDINNKDNCILIVGAGSGNDVAVANSMGAACVDAVEIDRTFPELGKFFHPQNPYGRSNVNLHIDDARAYFKKAATSGRKYALIIFGTLDSMALTGGHSTRLDSYVYTEESFRDAYNLLKPGGVIGVHHMSTRTYIVERILLSLKQLNGKTPLAWNYSDDHTLFNWSFVQTKIRSHEKLSSFGNINGEALEDHVKRIEKTTKIPTDNWPFLFLEDASIPEHYIYVLVGVLAISALLIKGSLGTSSIHLPMFFLGAGFLLLETKSVTQMSLLFGSTWIVNLLVFSSILFYLIIANLMVKYRNKGMGKTTYTSIFFTLVVLLIALSFLPAELILNLNIYMQWIFAGTIIALPIGLAGILFSALFSETEDMQSAFASNLLGAVFGGGIEYGVMVFGISSLSLLAGIFYLLAFYYHGGKIISD